MRAAPSSPLELDIIAQQAEPLAQYSIWEEIKAKVERLILQFDEKVARYMAKLDAADWLLERLPILWGLVILQLLVLLPAVGYLFYQQFQRDGTTNTVAASGRAPVKGARPEVSRLATRRF